MRDHTAVTDTRDADNEQAQIFIAHLEAIATQLEQQVNVLDATANMRVAKTAARLHADAHARRHELYEVRRQIDALSSRFPK